MAQITQFEAPDWLERVISLQSLILDDNCVILCDLDHFMDLWINLLSNQKIGIPCQSRPGNKCSPQNVSIAETYLLLPTSCSEMKGRLLFIWQSNHLLNS